MNPSPTYAHRAPQPKSYLGIGLVVALHLAGIYALSAGLIKTPPRTPEITTLKPLPPDVVRDPPPPEPLRPHEPTLRNPERVLVPAPDITIAPSQEPPLISAEAAPKESGPVVSISGPTQGVAPSQPVTRELVQPPGAVCNVMPKPELPALNWSGEAVLQVLATVRGGRVVGSDFRVAQGALDSKTKRSLQRSVESALAGYQCQGDAVFQQDFAFRLD
jgi:periplasmic protein TonB